MPFCKQRLKQRLAPLLTVMSLVGLSGCGGWDDEASFPENYSASYVKLHECKESAHPAANYVITWLSPEGEQAWQQMMEGMMGGAEPGPLPTGTVLVKAQYNDSSCSDLSGYTAMEQLEPGAKPELGDFKWQFLDSDGSCNNCDAGSSCSGCHTTPNCGGAFPYVCTGSESAAP